MLVLLNLAVGDYDVVIPEDTPAGDYSIRVGVFEEDSLYGCSGAFEVEPSHVDVGYGAPNSMSYLF